MIETVVRVLQLWPRLAVTALRMDFTKSSRLATFTAKQPRGICIDRCNGICLEYSAEFEELWHSPGVPVLVCL